MPARKTSARVAPAPVVAAAPASPPKAGKATTTRTSAAPAKAATAKRPTAAPSGAAAAKAAPAPAAAKSVKPAKAPKLQQKPVRDSFTMPEADFALIATLKARALGARRETKKSELLRAGLHALAALDTPALVAALGRLDPVKVGRPKKGH